MISPSWHKIELKIIKKEKITSMNYLLLNVDLKNNQLLDLINLKGAKTIYTPTETTPFLISIIRKFINNNIVVVLENNEIARKVFQDCQSFLEVSLLSFIFQKLKLIQ